MVRAVTRLSLAIAVLLCTTPFVSSAQETSRYWWAEREVCLPDSTMPRHQACGLSRIGPWASREDCARHGPVAWAIEQERMAKSGWGGLILSPDLYCTYRGPQDTIS